MNLITTSVTRPSQVEPGVFYLLCGTTANGKIPIPPQVIQVLTKPFAHTLIDDPVFDVIMWINAGPSNHLPPQRVTMTMSEINIPEHGTHDRHLERVGDEVIKALEKLYKINFYGDIATDTSMYKQRNGT